MSACAGCGALFAQRHPRGRQFYCCVSCRESAGYWRRRRHEAVACKKCGESYQRVVQRNLPGLCPNCQHAKGKDHHNYNGGLTFSSSTGRWQIACADGSHAYYYRAVVEAHIGRHLRADEHVHHLNGDMSDDRLENLAVMSKKQHMRLHMLHRHAKAAEERANAAAQAWWLEVLWQRVYGEPYPEAQRAYRQAVAAERKALAA